ncbi:MAG: glutamate racemase [Clostridia bacterium]|nr:glutamate racemase [Clostridia bacterium]
MNSNLPIGVFDSGLGGLTAVKELKKVLPNESIVYFGDTGRVPYGTRSKSTIIRYASQDANFLLEKGVKAIVAACGTVSSSAKEELKKLPVPYIDVITATALAAVNATQNKKIGVIGTGATVKSGSFSKAINAIDSEIEVTATACPLFVSLVENGFIEEDNEVTLLVAKKYLKDIIEADVDTLILGCTHFPIIAPVIRKVMGEKVKLIDSGKETARYVKEILSAEALLNNSESTAIYNYFVSDDTENFKNIAEIFLQGDIDGEVERIDIGKYKRNIGDEN